MLYQHTVYVDRKCAVCGRWFVRRAGYARIRAARYCSRDCFLARTPADRFWEKVDTSGDCWTWTAAKDRRGYGRFKPSVDRTAVFAHRFALELTQGPIPDGMQALHHCDNPSCVRPDHLYLGTVADNARDKVERHRSLTGERNHKAKLSPEQVAAIRSFMPQRRGDLARLAREMGVSSGTVSFIRSGKRWGHLST